MCLPFIFTKGEKMQHYDITIIGAGPAGSTLARTLGKKYKVLLVDKRPLDKEPSKLIKNCGGLIAPDAQKALASFGLSIPKDVLVSPQMFSVETIDFDNDMLRTYQRHYINVDRERYDRWLFSLCENSCEQLFSTRYRGVVPFPELVEGKRNGEYIVKLLQNSEQIEVSTDIIVGADGANSKVKRELIGKQEHEPKRYISIQEWFPNNRNVNQFVAMFDKEISDFYSWIIPKDDGIVFGSAVEEGKSAQKYHDLQKEKLKAYGYELSNPTKREGCHLLRPMSSKDICLGEDSVALIGEASGLVSPTSAEGISYAMLSGDALGRAILEDKENFLDLYKRNGKSLKKNIDSKMRKYPVMYNQIIRKLIFKLGIGAIEVPRRCDHVTRQKKAYVV
ncbi:MAG TPA: FAD-binding protein [Sulfurospirillum arcachonense]|nr:FAD-binding protein [Sulfurospirillum arcachonense]HIP41652.1 FAD-binding protein [Campylobacterales bacterium]